MGGDVEKGETIIRIIVIKICFQLKDTKGKHNLNGKGNGPSSEMELEDYSFLGLFQNPFIFPKLWTPSPQ